MKTIIRGPFFLIVLLLTSGLSFGQQPLTLSEAITVADGATYGAIRPRIVLSGQTPVVLFGKTGTEKTLNVARWNGVTFSAPVNILPTGLNIILHPLDAPSIAANGNDIFATFFTLPHTSSEVYIVKSADGGITWSDTIRVTHIGDSVPTLTDIEILGNGDPIVSFIKTDLNWEDPDQMVARSTDVGFSFLPAVNGTALTTGEPCNCCASAVVTSGNTVALLFRNNDNDIRDAFASISFDGGATFDDLVQVDFSGWNIPVCPSSGPVGFISGNTLNVAWRTERGGGATIQYGSLNLQTLQAGVNYSVDPLAGVGSSQDQPQMAGNLDTIGVVWQDGRNGSSDIYFGWSTTGPSGFNQPVNITDSLNTVGSQISPDIAYSKGVFHLVYHDQINNRAVYRTVTIPTADSVNTAVEVNNDFNLSVSPVPASDIVRLEWSLENTMTELRIFNMNGNSAGVYQLKEINPFFDLDIAHLAQGQYLVVLKGKRETELSARFVKID